MNSRTTRKTPATVPTARSRGLIRLHELGGLGVLATVQLGLALWLTPVLALLLALNWAYFVLMSKEFFVGDWLKAHPIIYLLSHMVIMPLVDFYATACDWLPAGAGPPPGLEWFVAVSYSNGVVIELGRKIRSPADEETGVNTYGAPSGGPRVAVAVWLGVLLLTAAAGGVGGVSGSLPRAGRSNAGRLFARGGAGDAAAFLRGQAPGQGKGIKKRFRECGRC